MLIRWFHQTWLDERLFGWSKSANRGTSAWAGATRSQEISRAATPDLSEDEEVADYDNVLGYLPIYEGAPHGHHRIRSKQNSYADLQKLRMSAIGKGTRFDFLIEFLPGLPEMQEIHTEISRFSQARWVRARVSTSAGGIASGGRPSPMVLQSTASQRSTDKRSSRRRPKSSIGKSRNTGTRLTRDYLFFLPCLFSVSLVMSCGCAHTPMSL